MTSFFDRLPDDTIKQILSLLPLIKRIAIGRTCKLFYELVTKQADWEICDFQGIENPTKRSTASISPSRIVKFPTEGLISFLAVKFATSIRSLDLTNLTFVYLDPILIKIIEQFPNLEKLSLSNACKWHVADTYKSGTYPTIGVHAVKILHRPKLQCLNLSYTRYHVSDNMIAKVCKACPNIKILLVAASNAGPETLSSLLGSSSSVNTNLEVLDIDDSDMNPDSKYLECFPNLKEIRGVQIDNSENSKVKVYSGSINYGTSIWETVTNGNWQDLLPLIDQINAPDMIYMNGLSILHYASCITSDNSFDILDVVRPLVEQCNANVNIQSLNLLNSDQSYSVPLLKVNPFQINQPPLVSKDWNPATLPVIFAGRSLCSPLHCASFYNNETLVSYLISKGAKVDIENSDGSTPLMLACSQQNLEVARLLLESGASIHATDHQGWTALHYAILGTTTNQPTVSTNFSREIFDLLLSHGADINHIDREGLLPIIIACTTSCLPLLQFLRSRGAEFVIEGKPFLGFHYLLLTTKGNQTISQIGAVRDCLNWLLDQGVPVNDAHPSGNNTALHTLCKKLPSLAVEFLRNKEAFKSCSIRNDAGYLPIHCLCKMGPGNDSSWQELLSILIEYDPNQLSEKTFDNETPLMIACENNPQVALTLIENGSNTADKFDDGSSILHLVVNSAHIDMILPYLVDQINTKDNNSVTPLQAFCRYLARRHHEREGFTFSFPHPRLQDEETTCRTIKLLVNNGADLNVQDGVDGKTPLHVLASHYQFYPIFKDIVETFRDRIDFHKRDAYNNTLLHTAAFYGSMDTVIFLIKLDIYDINDTGYLNQHILSMCSATLKFLSSGFTFVKAYTDTVTSQERYVTRLLPKFTHNPKDRTPINKILTLLSTKKLVLDKKDSLGLTPMHHIIDVLPDSDTAIELVINAVLDGADTQVRDNNGNTILWKIITSTETAKDFLELSKLLIEKPSFDRYETNKDGLIPLLAAAKYSSIIFDVLLPKYDINEIFPSTGGTILHFIIDLERTSAVEGLIKKGANCYIPNKEGFTPFHLLIKLDRADINEIMKLTKIDINIQNPITGETALHYALSTTNTNKWLESGLVELLLEHGADPTIRDHNGISALDFFQPGPFRDHLFTVKKKETTKRETEFDIPATKFTSKRRANLDNQQSNFSFGSAGFSFGSSATPSFSFGSASATGFSTFSNPATTSSPFGNSTFSNPATTSTNY